MSKINSQDSSRQTFVKEHILNSTDKRGDDVGPAKTTADMNKIRLKSYNQRRKKGLVNEGKREISTGGAKSQPTGIPEESKKKKN